MGVVGPLLLDGLDYIVPMATTEGCLVASTNRGCKAIYQSGGATSILLKYGMSRDPIVRFKSIKRAAELNFYVEEPSNFDALSVLLQSCRVLNVPLLVEISTCTLIVQQEMPWE